MNRRYLSQPFSSSSGSRPAAAAAPAATTSDEREQLRALDAEIEAKSAYLDNLKKKLAEKDAQNAALEDALRAGEERIAGLERNIEEADRRPGRGAATRTEWRGPPAGGRSKAKKRKRKRTTIKGRKRKRTALKGGKRKRRRTRRRR